MEMICLEEPVLALAAAIQRNPIQRALCEREFFRGVTGKADTCNQGVLEPRAKRSLCFVKVAAGKILLARRGANSDAVEFYGRTRGLLVNCSLSAKARAGQANKSKAAQKRVPSEMP